MIVHDQKNEIFGTVFCELHKVLEIFHEDFFIYPSTFCSTPSKTHATPGNIDFFTKRDLGKIKLKGTVFPIALFVPIIVTRDLRAIEVTVPTCLDPFKAITLTGVVKHTVSSML